MSVPTQPLTDVWHLIKLPSFSQWWSALEKSEVVKGTSDETDIYRFTFKVRFQLNPHSISLRSA